MEQCPGKIAGIYRWSNPPDELWVSLSDILKRIPEPLPNKTTWTIEATGMLKVCSILRIATDVNF
jgi:hypothetical protein